MTPNAIPASNIAPTNRQTLDSLAASAAALPAYRLAVEAIGVLVVALTGHLGGVLAGVN